MGMGWVRAALKRLDRYDRAQGRLMQRSSEAGLGLGRAIRTRYPRWVGVLFASLVVSLVPLGLVLIVVPQARTRGVVDIVFPALAALGVGLSARRAMRAAKDDHTRKDRGSGGT